MNFIKLFFLFFMVPQFVFSEEKDLVKVLVSDKNFYSNINKKDDKLTYNSYFNEKIIIVVLMKNIIIHHHIN